MTGGGDGQVLQMYIPKRVQEGVSLEFVFSGAIAQCSSIARLHLGIYHQVVQPCPPREWRAFGRGWVVLGKGQLVLLGASSKSSHQQE